MNYLIVVEQKKLNNYKILSKQMSWIIKQKNIVSKNITYLLLFKRYTCENLDFKRC